MRRFRTRFLALLILLTASLAPSRPTQAQQAFRVSLKAAAGLEGSCKQDAWIPLKVILENQGPAVEGQVEARLPNFSSGGPVYAQRVSLPTASRKEYLLTIYPSGYVSRINVVFTSQGKEIAQAAAPVTCVSLSDRLFGVLADNASPFNILSEVDPPSGNTQVVHLAPDDLPANPQALQALDALVVAGVDTGQLDQAQLDALAGWLSSGGTLIVAGGPDYRRSTAGLGDFLPLKPEGLQEVSGLPGLADFAGRPDSATDLTEKTVISTGALIGQAQVLVELAGRPLLANRRYGYGQVWYLAADPALEPLKSWDGAADFYRKLLSVQAEKPVWASGIQDRNSAANAASTFPDLNLPSGLAVMSFICVYVMAIGPLHFVVLRKLRSRSAGRLPLAWLSLPAIAILFSLAAFVTGAQLRGSQPVLNQLAVIRVAPDSPQARVDGMIGIFSPNRQSYQLEIDPAFQVSLLSDQNSGGPAASQIFLKDESGRTLLSDLRLEIGGIRSFALSGQAPAPRLEHTIEIAFGSNGVSLEGSLWNRTEISYKDAVLLFPGDSLAVGELDPGQRFDVQYMIGSDSRAAQFSSDPSKTVYTSYNSSNLMSDILGSQDFYKDRHVFRRYNLLNAITGYNYYSAGTSRNGVTLAAWSEVAPFETTITGKQFRATSMTLLLADLKPALSIKGSSITLPPGLFTWSLLDPGMYGSAGPYETFLSTGGYSLSFQFAYPLDYRSVNALTLHLKSYNAAGPTGLNVSLWDFQHQQWQPQPALDWGDHAISNPERFVGPGGEVRLELENANNLAQVSIETADISMVVER